MDSIQVESQYSSELNRFVGLNYENALSQSLQAVLDSLQNPNFENFSKFTSDFRELVQFKINPSFEAIWVYTALAFRSSNSTKDEPLEKLSAIKDLFQLITTYSASCNSLNCILLIAPVIYNLHKLVLGFKNLELSSKKEKKFFREIVDFSDSVLGYTSVCSDGLYCDSHNLDDHMIRPLKDMVGLWVWDEKVQSDTDKGRMKNFFPLLGEDIVEEISSAKCGLYELSGHVIAEAFLLKLCLAFSGKSSSGKESQIELRNWAVGAITGHRNSYFFDSLLRMLLDPPLPLSSLLIPEYEMLLRNVLYDSVILVEYHFLNPERLTHLPAKHAKSLAFGRLIVTHEAIELLREQEDQTKALSYTNAFSSSTLPSYLIKWIRNEIGGEFDCNEPNGLSPKAFIRWILNIENRGVKIFDDYMSKYRAKLVADNTKDLKLLAYNEKTKDLDIDIPFYIDNKGEEESENVNDEKMNAAFVAAAHSLQSGEESGGKKRKAESSNKRIVPKFIKYNLCEDSILSGERSSLASDDDSSSGGEVNNPSSDEE